MVERVSKKYVEAIKSFRKECSKLLLEFNEINSEDFRDFTKVWKSNQFTLLYERYAKKYGLESDFREDTLHIAKSIMINETFVGGLFLLYGLYYMQGAFKKPIRLELEEFQKITRRLQEDKETLVLSCQPGYIFAKMLKSNAFHFVKFSREYTLEKQKRAQLVFDTEPVITSQKVQKEFQSKNWALDLFEDPEFSELVQLRKHYCNLKAELKQEYPDLQLSLNLVQKNIVDDLQKYIDSKEGETANETPAQADPEDIGTRRRIIKNRIPKIKYRYASSGRPTNKQKARAEAILREEAKKAPKRARDRPPLKVKRGRGCPNGQRTSYLKTMINNASEQEIESCSSSLDKSVGLDLPDIL